MSAAVEMFRLPHQNSSDSDDMTNTLSGVNASSSSASSSSTAASSAVSNMSVTSDSPLSTSFDTATDSESSAAATNKRRMRRKKKRLCGQSSLSTARFKDIYYLTGDVLGEGSYGRVETCINMFTDVEYAVKLINKSDWCFSRAKVLKEVEIYYLCQGQPNIIQLVEYFEESDYFFLVFEKANGGPLLDQIQRRVKFTEEEAAKIVRDLASALKFLHDRGIAHRDLKPENVLCVDADSPWPIKLCDFDLCSGVHQSITTPLLQSPVGSAEYMAPEVVNAFSTGPYERDADDADELLSYDKRCDLWSLGVMSYVLLCGYLPFAAGQCENDDCGWESGDEECASCQRRLFQSIRSGDLVFPEQHSWGSVSGEAKDLISRLLVRDANRRMDAQSVLEHPWIVGGGSKAAVETPAVLRRQTSTTSLKWAPLDNSSVAARFYDQQDHLLAVDNKHHLRKKSVNDRLLSGGVGFANENETVVAKTRKTSMAASMMRRQTSLIFPDGDDKLLQLHPSHFSLHRCEL